MKLGVAVVLAFAASTANAQAPFEGIVTMRVTPRMPAGQSSAPPRSQDLEYLMSGGKTRVNITGMGPGSAMLMVPAEKKMYVLMAAQNTYMEMPMAEVAAAATPKKALPEVQVTRSGKKETIAGYSCEHVMLTAKDETATHVTDVCVAKGLGAFSSAFGGQMSGQQPAWQRQLSDMGFPLRVTVDDQTMLEVTSIEKKRLDKALFSIPLNYTRMAAPQRR